MSGGPGGGPFPERPGGEAIYVPVSAQKAPHPARGMPRDPVAASLTTFAFALLIALAVGAAGLGGSTEEAVAEAPTSGPAAAQGAHGISWASFAAQRRCAARRATRVRRPRTARLRCARLRRLTAPGQASGGQLLAGVGVGTPAPGPGGSPGSDPAPAPPALGRFVSVATREFSLTLSRPVVASGAVTVELRNLGEDPHNLLLGPDDGGYSTLADWPETAPGDYLRQSVTLPVGRYRLWCSLPGHEAAGMSVTLRVE